MITYPAKLLHSYGPRIRDYILIHFVLSGKGSVDVDGTTYILSSGQAFVIPANSKCSYIADKTDPWEYCWVAFYASSDILPLLLPVSSRAYIHQNINVQYIKNIILRMISRQFSFQKNAYAEKEFNSEQKIAREFSIHPNYLTSLFKSAFGISPKQYIINKRISTSCNFLETSNHSIRDIAYMVGYENQLEFSQIFKKAVGKSPTAYRNEYL
ncbi:MAG: AraC family transcriptional regulator [Lachnospiraceae bacterium]